jgi:hypothetical protein
MVSQAEDRTRAKRQQAEIAIQLALQGKWKEAAQLNKQLTELFPTDVDAYNRLGKAFTELGRYEDARRAYESALEIDSLNSIARKNLTRLSTLGKKASPRAAVQKLSPQMFIEETGKTGTTLLMEPNMKAAARMTAGDQVSLERKGNTLVVVTTDGEPIGEIEPRLGQRLARLMDGGNEYVAAISALEKDGVRAFIRETFQHASQTGKLSFTPTANDFRPYVKGRMVRYDTDDDAYLEEEAEDADEWTGSDSDEEEGPAEDNVLGVGVSGRAPNIDLDDEMEE